MNEFIKKEKNMAEILSLILNHSDIITVGKGNRIRFYQR